MTHARNTTLIIGGTGKTGRRVAERLAAQGRLIRVASRSGETRFDWNDQSTWGSALDDVTAVYLTYSPDLAVPEAPPAIEAFAHHASNRGVERLVLLSGRGEDEAQRCERIVLQINPSWTVVRASWFNQNFSEGFFADQLREGVLRLPAGSVVEPFIDADDIADVAVAALTESGHDGRIYEVTGPRLMTFAEAVQDIATASGRALRYEEIPIEEFTRGMLAAQVSESVVSLTRYLFETVLDGRNASTADGVHRALGRAPRDFADYAREMAAAGVWAVPDTRESGRVSSSMSESASNERVIRRFIDDVFNSGDISALDEIVHQDYVFCSPGEQLRGREGLATLIKGYREAFPDFRIEIDELLVVNEATVLEFTLTGTHRGEFLGIPASGRRIRVNGMVRSRFRDGRIAEEWEILDQLSLFEQLGVVGGSS